jgi:hypothetical protein
MVAESHPITHPQKTKRYVWVVSALAAVATAIRMIPQTTAHPML